MLDKQIRTRANSFYDGGQAGGDVRRVQISFRSRFVLSFRVGVRVKIARAVAISLVASAVVTGSANFSLDFDPRLVQPSSEAGAKRMAEGADTGSAPASQGAIGSESTSKTPPASLIL